MTEQEKLDRLNASLEELSKNIATLKEERNTAMRAYEEIRRKELPKQVRDLITERDELRWDNDQYLKSAPEQLKGALEELFALRTVVDVWIHNYGVLEDADIRGPDILAERDWLKKQLTEAIDQMQEVSGFVPSFIQGWHLYLHGLKPWEKK